MNILLDTHIALWSMYDDNRLDSTAISMLTDENNIIFERNGNKAFSKIVIYYCNISH